MTPECPAAGLAEAVPSDVSKMLIRNTPEPERQGLFQLLMQIKERPHRSSYQIGAGQEGTVWRSEWSGPSFCREISHATLSD